MEHEIQSGVKGLIFDLDGTLADTMPYHFAGWKKACKKFGADIDASFLKKHTGSPGWIIAAEVIKEFKLNGDVTTIEIEHEKTVEFFKLQHLVQPIKPVTDIVKKYYGKLLMAVGTGGHRDVVERTLDITDLRKYFDIIVTANDVSHYKPHPETFLKCAEIMRINPAQIEVFEDSDLGIRAANNAGMIATDVRSWYDSFW